MKEIALNGAKVDYSGVQADNRVIELDDVSDDIGDFKYMEDDLMQFDFNAKPLIQDDPVEKRAILMKVKSYKQLFEKHLTDIDLSNLDLRSIDELTVLLKEIRLLVSNRNTANMIKGSFMTGVTVVESVSPMVGLQLQGLTACMNTEEINDILNEIHLENQEYTHQPATTRLFLSVMKTAMVLHMHNKQQSTIPQDYNLDETVEDTYDDL